MLHYKHKQPDLADIYFPDIRDLLTQVGKIQDISELETAEYTIKQRIPETQTKHIPISLLSAVHILTVQLSPVQATPLKETNATLIPSFPTISPFSLQPNDAFEYAKQHNLTTQKENKKHNRQEYRHLTSFLATIRRLKKALKERNDSDEKHHNFSLSTFLKLAGSFVLSSLIFMSGVVKGIPFLSSVTDALGLTGRTPDISTQTTSTTYKPQDVVSPTYDTKTTTFPITPKVLAPMKFSSKTGDNITADKLASTISTPNSELNEGQSLVRQNKSLLASYIKNTSKITNKLPLATTKGVFSTTWKRLLDAVRNYPIVTSALSAAFPMLSAFKPFASPQQTQQTAPTAPQQTPTNTGVPSFRPTPQSAPTQQPNNQCLITPDGSCDNVSSATSSPITNTPAPTITSSVTAQSTRPVPQAVSQTTPITPAVRYDPKTKQVTTVTPPAQQTPTKVQTAPNKTPALLQKDPPLQRFQPSSNWTPPKTNPLAALVTQQKVSLYTVPLVPTDERLYNANLIRR